MNKKLSNSHPFLCCYAHLSIVLLGPVVDGVSLGVQSIISILNPAVLMISSSSSLWDALEINFFCCLLMCTATWFYTGSQVHVTLNFTLSLICVGHFVLPVPPKSGFTFLSGLQFFVDKQLTIGELFIALGLLVSLLL